MIDGFSIAAHWNCSLNGGGATIVPTVYNWCYVHTISIISCSAFLDLKLLGEPAGVRLSVKASRFPPQKILISRMDSCSLRSQRFPHFFSSMSLPSCRQDCSPTVISVSMSAIFFWISWFLASGTPNWILVQETDK